MVDALIACLVFGHWVRLLWEALVLHTSWVVCDGAVRSQVTGPVGPQEWTWTDSGVHLVWNWICVWFQAGTVCLLLKVTADVVAAGSWPRPGVNMVADRSQSRGCSTPTACLSDVFCPICRLFCGEEPFHHGDKQQMDQWSPVQTVHKLLRWGGLESRERNRTSSRQDKSV